MPVGGSEENQRRLSAPALSFSGFLKSHYFSQNKFSDSMNKAGSDIHSVSDTNNGSTNCQIVVDQCDSVPSSNHDDSPYTVRRSSFHLSSTTNNMDGEQYNGNVRRSSFHKVMQWLTTPQSTIPTNLVANNNTAKPKVDYRDLNVSVPCSF